uniref:Uncharacterized protein n=1 Tax=Octopus bimaculoides TaxID=37653 RepID=A0A0L8G5F7_OCTBM
MEGKMEENGGRRPNESIKKKRRKDRNRMKEFDEKLRRKEGKRERKKYIREKEIIVHNMVSLGCERMKNGGGGVGGGGRRREKRIEMAEERMYGGRRGGK